MFMTNFHIISLFPESFESYLGASIVKRAQERKIISIKYYNPRDFVVAKEGKNPTYAERRVDNRPYGGGPGMVIEALPVIKAIEKAVWKKIRNISEIRNTKNETRNKAEIRNSKSLKTAKVKIIFFSPSGKQFSNDIAEDFKKYTDIVLVCGRYEGIDARVKKAFPMTDISVGPYVLTGGELPAMIVIDSITRRIPGVLGDDLSVEESRIACSDVYTRPEVLEYKKKKLRVPKVLLEGNHKKIEEWKRGRAQRD